MLQGVNLGYYYNLLYILKSNHNFSVEEYDNLVPYEREVLVTLINNKVELENLKRAQEG